MRILSGKIVAEKIHQELKEKIASLKIKPKLAVVLVGDHAPSHTYVEVKKKACQSVGIELALQKMPQSVSEKEILSLIDNYNQDSEIHGILIQLPLPQQIDSVKVLEKIDPRKDVDGFHPLNVGKLLLGLTDGFIPCTPLGIHVLLQRYEIPLEGKHAVIVGRSNIVGKPLAALWMQKKPEANATVTIAHGNTHNLPAITRTADILVAALGVPRFIKRSMVKSGAVIIDVGIHKEIDPKKPKGYTIVGDVDFSDVAAHCKAISPVPYGVGPMTVAMLLHNTLKSAENL